MRHQAPRFGPHDGQGAHFEGLDVHPITRSSGHPIVKPPDLQTQAHYPMNYPECLKYLADLGQELHGLKFGLEAISLIMVELGRPHERYQTAIVAGTNGKGSCCAMLASIVEHAGYSTGMFTSPHLVRVNERIRVNGREVSDEDFATAFTAVAATVERLVNLKKLEKPPSFFEFLTATAFLHFANAKVKFAVLEVGMGAAGRNQHNGTARSPDYRYRLRPYGVPRFHTGRHRGGKGRHHQAASRRGFSRR